MIEEAAHGRCRINVLGVADEIDAKRRELLKGSQDAQRASKPVVFSNQDAIETPAARIFHQLAIGPVVLALGSAPLHVAADVIDVLLKY